MNLAPQRFHRSLDCPVGSGICALERHTRRAVRPPATSTTLPGPPLPRPANAISTWPPRATSHRCARTPSPASPRISRGSRAPSKITSRISPAAQASREGRLSARRHDSGLLTPSFTAECSARAAKPPTAPSFYLDNLPAGKYGVVLLDADFAERANHVFFNSAAGGEPTGK